MLLGVEPTYSLLSSLPSHTHQRIMVLFDMEVQEMLCGEILLALEATIGMCLCVMDIIFFEGGKCEGRSMWWEGAPHFHLC